MNEKPFYAVVRTQDKLVTIDLFGDINSDAEQDLYEAYAQANQSNTSAILLNFSKVSYINSTGIALIVGLLSQARKAKKELLVFGLSDHYTEIFRITRLSDFMKIYPDEGSLQKDFP